MPKVLIADDQPEMRRLWAINLSARNYEVSEAADGRECLRMIVETEPDVILLDLSMPVLSGWDVLEALMDRSVVTQAPVIVVTGWPDKNIEALATQLGAVGTLIKPFGVDELLRAIEKALEGVGD